MPSSNHTQDEDQAFPTLELDLDKYREHLADTDITDEQAAAFLQILWNIMHTMIDIGMGLDSVQMFLPRDAEISGQDSGKDIKQTERSVLFNKTAATTDKE